MKTGFSETLIGWKSGKPLMSLYGTEWIERGYGLWILPERDKCKPVLLRLS
jgi:hypothetical protein